MQNERDWLDRIDDGLASAEGVVLVAVMAVMVGLSFLQFFLRKTFDFGFEWADIVVRQMVLWSGFFGGALATHKNRHIAIDVVNRILRPERAAWIRVFTSLISAFIAGVMVYAAWMFLMDEIDAESTVFGEVPSWTFQGIIPIALGLIVFHFAVQARNQILIALGRRPATPSEADEAKSEPAS